MIVTAKKNVPSLWVLFAIMPWASFASNNGMLSVAFLFSLKKFIENPAGLTFVLSLPIILAVIVAPLASFFSDRIWTRFGRRKPFIIFSWVGMIAALALMPLMPNFWLLLSGYLLYQFAADLNSPMEPLKQEIIPPHERGRATGAMQWLSNLATITFYFVLLGRFDDVSYLAGLPLQGEAIIYWSAGLLLVVMLMIVVLGIRETDQKSALVGQRITLRNFVGGLLDRELWPVYLLVFANAFLNFYAGLGPLSNLLYTDQWGYTKQEMGVNVAIGGIANIFIIGALTVFADRLNRMRAYQTTITLSLLGNVCYFCYVNFMLPDRRPTLVEIILFGEVLSILAVLTNLLYIPLVYDYVRRNKMGTYAAGASMVTRLTTLFTLNGVGLFVTFYAQTFQPPAGEMTRVTLREESRQDGLLTALRAVPWPAALAANVWQGNGVTADHGRTWEIRLRNAASEHLAAEKTALEKERSPLLSKQAIALDSGGANSYQARIDAISRRIKEIDAELTGRSAKFRDAISKVLGSRLIAEGDEVLGTAARPAIVIELPSTRRPEGKALEKILGDLRREAASVIDLRPLKRDTGYALEFSALEPTGEEPAALTERLRTMAQRTANRRDPGLLATGNTAPSAEQRTALTLDLLLAEDPLDRAVSPVTRTANAVLGFFDRAPSPTRRLDAIARSLRSAEGTNHVRADPGQVARSISVTAVLPSIAPPAAALADDAPMRKLTALLGANSDKIASARALYGAIETAAATQRITVSHPVFGAAFAPMRYDYMSGYLWMFLMGLIGISLTVVFRRLEARGRGPQTRRRGGAGLMNAPLSQFTPLRATTPPVIRGAKLLMVIFGLAAFVFGLSQLATPLTPRDLFGQRVDG